MHWYCVYISIDYLFIIITLQELTNGNWNGTSSNNATHLNSKWMRKLNLFKRMIDCVESALRERKRECRMQSNAYIYVLITLSIDNSWKKVNKLVASILYIERARFVANFCFVNYFSLFFFFCSTNFKRTFKFLVILFSFPNIVEFCWIFYEKF